MTCLTAEQIKRLVECAKQDQNEHVYPFIVIGVETSMRMMEILRIRREHVDLDRMMITIPKAKAGARAQPITSHLADFLRGNVEALDPRCPWLSPSLSAREGHTADIREPFRRVVAAAGSDPKEVVRHTLRHAAITYPVQAGVDLPAVQRISGHKTLTMVARYAHQNGEHLRTAMDKLQDRLHRTGQFSGTITPESHKCESTDETGSRRFSANSLFSLVPEAGSRTRKGARSGGS